MSSTEKEEVAEDITRSNSAAKLLRWLQDKWAAHQRRLAAASSAKSGLRRRQLAMRPGPCPLGPAPWPRCSMQHGRAQH
jgi:hypothetical protein